MIFVLGLQFHCTGQKKSSLQTLCEIYIYTIIAATGKCKSVISGARRIKHVLKPWFGGFMGFLIVFI